MNYYNHITYKTSKESNYAARNFGILLLSFVTLFIALV